jgi:hypothetical protein
VSGTRDPIQILATSTITELSASVDMCMVTLKATIEVTFIENSEVFAGLVIVVNGDPSNDSPSEASRSSNNGIITLRFNWTGFGYQCIDPSTDFKVEAKATIQTSTPVSGSASVTALCPGCL